MFPDVTFTEQDPGWDNEVIYDQRDKSTPFQKYVERLEVYFRHRLEETSRSQPAKALGLEIPDKLLALADEVTE